MNTTYNNKGGRNEGIHTAVPTSSEPFNNFNNSEPSNLECKSEIGQVEYEEDESQRRSLRRSISDMSASSASKSQTKSLKMSYSRSSESSAFKSIKRSNDARSPSFEKGFFSNFEEIKKTNLADRYSSSAGFKGKTKKRTKTTEKRPTGKTIAIKKKRNDIGFYPHLSSVGGDTIQEKSDEEDIDESPPKARRNRGDSNENENSNSPSESRNVSNSRQIEDYSQSIDQSSENQSELPHFNSLVKPKSNNLISLGNDQAMTSVNRDTISEKDSENSSSNSSQH